MLGVAKLQPEAPVVRRLAPEPGQHPVEARELNRHGLVERLAGDPRRREQLARDRDQRAERRPHARAGAAREREAPDLLEVRRELHLRPRAHVVGEHVEAVVGVDAAAPRR